MEARACVSSGEAVDGGGTSKFLQPHHRQHHPKKPSAQIGTVPQLLAGGIAGAFSKTCTAPLARLTILFQVQGMQSEAAALSNPSIWREALRIVNEEGFRAFWKGNLVTIVHRLPYSAVNFYAYERYKSFLKSVPGLESHRGSTSADVFAHFVGGGLAGITAASATYPLDLVRTRLAAQTNTTYYRGIWHTIHTICRDEGYWGLYKGLGATLLGVGPSIAISFSVYESSRSYWHSQSILTLGLKILLPWLALLVVVFLALHHQQRHSLWILSGEECSWKVLLGKPVCIKLDFLVHLSIYSALKACVACTEEFCPNTTRLFPV
ncbi:uncharacterized protein LOC131326455 isoform X2 [Rhododendron vialii]|uniref:uncharacterized protein LOC131326455 isoform X2 n=1 Tax=Rhododendron vialii TaxID=182163 RepID=UPI00266039AF|nr:uncharacterized protein LOC131326455 isoform X2 [Rhododendron vialii]